MKDDEANCTNICVISERHVTDQKPQLPISKNDGYA